MMVYTATPRAKSHKYHKSAFLAAQHAMRLGARFISVRESFGRFVVNYYVK